MDSSVPISSEEDFGKHEVSTMEAGLVWLLPDR